MKQPPAFDPYAAAYDSGFTDTCIGRLQRQQVWKILGPYLRSPLRILEINCGTGADALRLARNGHQVIATDASVEMIRICHEKTAGLSPAADILFRKVRFQELESLQVMKPFDLIFSNFGGLNCIDAQATSRLSHTFGSLLKPEGKLFLVYMSSGCLWERWFFRFKGNREKAGRRKTEEAVEANVAGKPLDIWYYEPGKLQQLYGPRFRLVESRPIGLFVPPSYLETYFANKTFILNWMAMLDNFFNFPSLANYGDHFAVVFENSGSG